MSDGMDLGSALQRLGQSGIDYFAEYNRTRGGPDMVKIGNADNAFREFFAQQRADQTQNNPNNAAEWVPTIRSNIDKYLLDMKAKGGLTPEEYGIFAQQAGQRYAGWLEQATPQITDVVNGQTRERQSTPYWGYIEEAGKAESAGDHEAAQAALAKARGLAESFLSPEVTVTEGAPYLPPTVEERNRPGAWTPELVQQLKEAGVNGVAKAKAMADFEVNPISTLSRLKGGGYELNDTTRKAMVPLLEARVDEIQETTGNALLTADNTVVRDFDAIIATGVKEDPVVMFSKDESAYKRLLKIQDDAFNSNFNADDATKQGLAKQSVLDTTQATLDRVTGLVAAVKEKLKDPSDPSTSAERISEIVGNFYSAKANIAIGETPGSAAWKAAVDGWLKPYAANPRFKDVYFRAREDILRTTERDLKGLQDAYTAPLVDLKNTWQSKLGENASVAEQAYQFTIDQDAKSRTNAASGNAKPSDPAVLQLRYQQNLYNMLDAKGYDTKGLAPVPGLKDALSEGGVKAYRELMVKGSANDRGIGTSADETVLDAFVKGRALLGYESMTPQNKRAAATALNGLANGFYALAPAEALNLGRDAKEAEVVPAVDGDGNMALVVRPSKGTGDTKFFVPFERPREAGIFKDQSLWTWIEADPATFQPKAGATPLRMADSAVRNYQYKNISQNYTIIGR